MDLFEQLARLSYGNDMVDRLQGKILEAAECDHEWVHYPKEVEPLSGRGTVIQYPEYYECAKCGEQEDDLNE